MTSTTDLKTFLKENCESSSLSTDDLLKSLSDLGVETVDDLKDLLAFMKPIKIRKFLSKIKGLHKPGKEEEKTSSYTETIKVQPMPIQPPGNQSSPLHTFNLKSVLAKMPEIKSDIENGNRLKPDVRRKFVREVVDTLRNLSNHCSKKDFETVSQTVVRLHPSSFEDRIGEIRIGTGYDSLMKQLIARNENLNRHSTRTGKDEMTGGVNKKSSTEAVDGNKKRKTISNSETDSYGCLNWGPNITEDEAESLENTRNELKSMYGQSEDWDEINVKMEKSYGLLRKHINDGASLQQLLIDWPFLLNTNVLLKHCELLLGVNVIETVEKAYTNKAPILLRYLKSRGADTGTAYILSQLEKEKSSDNYPAILQGVILCIQKCLGEEEKSLMFSVDELASNDEVETSNEKSWPRLAMLGEDCLAAQQFALVVDGNVLGRYQSFLTALSLLFAMYYIFNIEYPKEAAATLEFIQRCFVGINPDKGMKTNKKKRSSFVNAKVLALINQLADFQWTG